MDRQHLIQRLDRLLAHIGQIRKLSSANRSSSKDSLPADRARQSAAPGVLILRLAVSTDRRGLLGRGRREPQDHLGVASRLGVVCQPDEIGGANRGLHQSSNRTTMKRDRPVKRQRLLDRHTRELMPEGDAVGLGSQDARAHALVKRLERPRRQCLKQPHLGPLRDPRDGIKQPPRRCAKTRHASQHRVPHSRRHQLRFGG